jgi:hypothetical protein
MQPQISEYDELRIRAELAAITRRIACPLIWHDRTESWPKKLYGATCFFLQFEERVIGVTANHVICAFEQAASENQHLVCQLRWSPSVDLTSAIIDRDNALDIATFSVTETILRTAEVLPVDCRTHWPPPDPVAHSPLSVCGFPESTRTTTSDQSAEFGAWGCLTHAESITDKEIIITYDPTRAQPNIWSPALPPLGFDLSGCSGGPTLLHQIRNGLHRWFPIALVSRGPSGQGTGLSGEFDMIRLARIHAIMANGSITKKEDAGWSPY